MAFSPTLLPAKTLLRKLFLLPSSGLLKPKPKSLSLFCQFTTAPGIAKHNRNTDKHRDKNKKQKGRSTHSESLVKRRTRSDRYLDEESFTRLYDNENSAHVPVLLGEVLDVFASTNLRSFVDCTLGAAGHSSAIINSNPEMKLYVGLDVDPTAHEAARVRINGVSKLELKVHTFLRNFKDIKPVLRELGKEGVSLGPGVDGILMDLGMSSMQVNDAERGFGVMHDGPLDMRMNPQATLKAEDILNSWPEAEVGKILREYGEESNWHFLQKKIVKSRSNGGLHSTRELVDLIRNSSSRTSGGRQGWIKTATRVFQALRIAVNDELNTLEKSIYESFDSLASGGRLAVISFHSLEDRIVKQTFLSIIKSDKDDGGDNNREDIRSSCDLSKACLDYGEKETWIKQIIQGQSGIILTKRPITPSEKEENLNPRSRSAKLRVIQKI